jgi:hypothetical protein
MFKNEQAITSRCSKLNPLQLGALKILLICINDAGNELSIF